VTIPAIGSELIRWFTLLMNYSNGPFGRAVLLLFGMAVVGIAVYSVRRIIMGRKP